MHAYIGYIDIQLFVYLLQLINLPILGFKEFHLACNIKESTSRSLKEFTLKKQNKKLWLIIYSPPCHPTFPCLSFFSRKVVIKVLMKTFQGDSPTICYFLDLDIFR